MFTIRELELWEAYETFGSQAVDEILHDPRGAIGILMSLNDWTQRR